MWSADLARTRTGQLGAHLDVESGGQGLTDETNGIPAGSASIQRHLLQRVNPSWWEPWRNSIIFSHRYSAADPWTPIIGGPITHYPSIDPRAMQLTMGGIQEVLARRYLVHEWTDYAKVEDWRAGGPWWEGSLGQIAWYVLQMAQAKPRGGLPIVHGTPVERITDATRKGRGWKNYDLAHGNVWTDVLKSLVDEDGGPDVRFTPRFAAGTTRRVEWVMEHGTHHDPRIAHAHTIRLDTTAAHSPVSDLSVTMSGLTIAHRVYGTGAGEGPGTEVRVAEALGTAVEEMPLLESVVSDTQLTAWRDVLSMAQGALSPGGLGAWQVSCKIHTTPALPLWQIRPGAPVRLRVTGLAPFPDGWVTGRVLKATYTLGSDVVAVEIEQEEAR